jgi:CelD/BcsL family acetyltransferase involved in cellulose biosynthesis
MSAVLSEVRPNAGCPKEWAIAIYGGASLETLAALDHHDRPALTFNEVSDAPARFVADPFLARHDGEWILFFEILNASREKGEIAIARSTDAVTWRYDGTVLCEPYHLSYPYVFQAGDEWLMTPETIEPRAVLLYRADDFPRRWSVDCVLIEGAWADPTVFEHDGLWWMFACSRPFQHDRLELFWAENVRGPWQLHPRSPIAVDDPRRSRPAGRPRVIDGRLVRFAQDCRPDYGNAVRAFAITTLTRDEYAEAELQAPVITASGSGWNANGMHTVDLHPWRGGWIAAVDGYSYSPAPQFEIAGTLAQFDALAEEWDTLAARSTAHGVFASHAWTRATLVANRSQAPHMATVRVDGELRAILPFVRTGDGMALGTDLSDYNDFIAADRLVAARAFNWILDTVPPGSRVVMRGLREGSDALAIARAYAPHVTIDAEATVLFAEIGGSYFAERSPGMRKAIARARRIARDAGAELVQLHDPELIVETFLALNRDRFGDASRFTTAAAQHFVREAIPPLLRRGSVAAFALVRDGVVLAIDLVLLTKDALAPWNGGFRADAAALSPGRLLFTTEIEHALAMGKRRFDMLRGAHPYKAPWSTGSETLQRAEILTR